MIITAVRYIRIKKTLILLPFLAILSGCGSSVSSSSDPAAYQAFADGLGKTAALRNYDFTKSVSERIGSNVTSEEMQYKLITDDFTGECTAYKKSGDGKEYYYQDGTEYYLDETNSKSKAPSDVNSFLEINLSSDFSFSIDDGQNYAFNGNLVSFSIKASYFTDKTVSSCLAEGKIEGSYLSYIKVDIKYSVSGVSCEKNVVIAYVDIGEKPVIILPDLSEYAY